MTIVFTESEWAEVAYPAPITMKKIATIESPIWMTFDGEWILDNGEW